MTKRIRDEVGQLFRLCLVNGLVDDNRAQEVLLRIVETKPRGCLEILSHFQHLVQLHRALHTAKVESAVPLPNDVRVEVQSGLARQYGAGLEVSFSEDPALIGGMRIQVGSDVYDGSVRARLAALEESF